MHTSLIASVVAVALCLGGCSSRRVTLAPAATMVTRDGVLSVWADFVQRKKDKFDLKLNFQNKSDRDLVFFIRDVTASRGTTPATVGFANFGIGERTVDLSPGQIKHLSLVCKHGAGATGDFAVRIGRVFENPSMDRKTPGAVIAEGIEWHLAESALER